MLDFEKIDDGMVPSLIFWNETIPFACLVWSTETISDYCWVCRRGTIRTDTLFYLKDERIHYQLPFVVAVLVCDERSVGSGELWDEETMDGRNDGLPR